MVWWGWLWPSSPIKQVSLLLSETVPDISPNENLVVIANGGEERSAAMHLADKLGVECLCGIEPAALDAGQAAFALVYDSEGVSLQQTGKKAPGPIRVDFAGGAAQHRRKFGGGKGQMIAKAVGLKSGVYPNVLDLTAGLGGDAFVLAGLGSSLTLVERSPVVQALLGDGLERARHAAQADVELAAVVERMALHCGDSLAYLRDLENREQAQVIYLDPMFPERNKTADVKKEMKAFHSLVGKDLDAVELLEHSLRMATYRVVVKRPRKAPTLGARSPSYQLQGKSSRYDIYTICKLPDKLNAG